MALGDQLSEQLKVTDTTLYQLNFPIKIVIFRSLHVYMYTRTRMINNGFFLYLQLLHKYGARKFVIAGGGKVGCTPAATESGKRGLCVVNMNVKADMFQQPIEIACGQI